MCMCMCMFIRSKIFRMWNRICPPVTPHKWISGKNLFSSHLFFHLGVSLLFSKTYTCKWHWKERVSSRTNSFDSCFHSIPRNARWSKFVPDSTDFIQYLSIESISEFWSRICWLPNSSDFIWYLSIVKWKIIWGYLSNIPALCGSSIGPDIWILEQVAVWIQDRRGNWTKELLSLCPNLSCVPRGRPSSSCLLDSDTTHHPHLFWSPLLSV